MAKFEQNIHNHEPYTVKIRRSEVSCVLHEEATDYYDFQYVSIVDKDDEEQAALIILHDKTEDRLNDIKRNNMINIIVHELKNPITGVIGLSGLMLDSDKISEEESQVLLSEIKLSGERMNSLVNRFLEIQRLESGRANIEYEYINLVQITERVLSITHPLLSEKRLKSTLTKDGTHFMVRGGSDLVFDAIQNLVSNAIKYGEQSRTIEIDVQEMEEVVKVSVTDHGYGIALEEQKKVFEKFYRVKSNKASAKENGTGLGLPYVREIMHRHKGEIELQSNEKIGSRFTLIFPKAMSEQGVT